MNKYKNLAFNTIIFAIGSFGSKILSFFLTRLYTTHMGADILGSKELLEGSAAFMIPVFSFSMGEAILRFGLDKEYDKRRVFSTSIAVQGAGLGLMMLLSPLFSMIPFIKGYTFWLMIYVCTSVFRQTCANFIRARGFVKLFAFDGMLATLTLFIFNIIFISKLGLGIKGFMIAMILSDFCSGVFLWTIADLGKFFKPSRVDKKTVMIMVRFSLPLIPTAIMWTITGFSDRILIKYVNGPAGKTGDVATGLYTAAARVPNLISMVSTIFFQAWNMSAITEHGNDGEDKFYETIFSAYQSIMYVASAFLILLVQPVSRMVLNYNIHPEYSTAYIYTPVLVMAVLTMCFNLFLSIIYTASKHTKNSFYTSLVSMLTNIILNVVLIKKFGVQGAVAASFISYLVCYIIRVIDARRYIYFKVDHVKTIMNMSTLLAMSLLAIYQPEHYILMETAVTVFITVVNFPALLATANKLLRNR